MLSAMTNRSPFRWFKTSPDFICLAAIKLVRFPLSQRNVKDLVNERGTDICPKRVRFWWHLPRRMCWDKAFWHWLRKISAMQSRPDSGLSRSVKGTGEGDPSNARS